MKRTSDFQPHAVVREDRPDGSILLRARDGLGDVVENTGVWLHRWAGETPQNVFLAERQGKGWRTEAFGATLEQVQAVARALLARGMGPGTPPILILSGNGVDHALLSLAAQYIGVPTVPLAEQYALVPAAQPRLRHAVELVRPAMAYVSDAQDYASALALEALNGIEIVASLNAGDGMTSFAELLRGDNSVDLASAHARVTPDTVAKILMTSGSASQPKGVLTTQRMLCANQAQIAAALPFLRRKPPRVVDWLPWNHVFGGSHNFNMMLANGGALYIDDGKPAQGLFKRTLENLRMVTGSLCFNVPVGFQMLLAALRADPDLRERFFEDLDLIFYAGASLPQDVWEGFEAMAMEVKGEVPLMTSSWGLTETAPAVLMQQEPTDRSGVVGVPLVGSEAKLVALDDARFEVRVKGPNVFEAYLDAPDKTAEAFDADGFFRTGDVMRLVDAEDINKGLRFDGRLNEEFKLTSGVWVRAAQVRLDVLACLAPLAADVVITGADEAEVGAMIFPNRGAFETAGFGDSEAEGALTDPALLAEIRTRLEQHAAGASSSTRVARAVVMAAPASMPLGEMTAKGNLNFRAVLTRRAGLLARLYADNDPAVVTLGTRMPLAT